MYREALCDMVATVSQRNPLSPNAYLTLAQQQPAAHILNYPHRSPDGQSSHSTSSETQRTEHVPPPRLADGRKKGCDLSS